MKTLILNFLFGRGVGWLSEAVSKAVRHGAGLYGGVLIGQELATQGQIDSIEGGLLAGASILWSVIRIKGPELIAKIGG